MLVAPILSGLTPGGIHLPQILQDEYNIGGMKLFRVLAVGQGRRTKKGAIVPIECEPGDRVICHSYFKGPIEIEGGQKIVSSDEIVMVLPKPQPSTNYEHP